MRMKPVWLAFPLFLLAMAPAAMAADFYTADFQGWRDNRTNPGFNATLTLDGSQAKVQVAGTAKFGKVMSPEEPVFMRVTPTLILQLTVDALPEGAVLNVSVTNASTPYDDHRVLSSITKPGTYNASIGRTSSWNGMKNFWVTFWVENASSPVVVSRLRIGENLVPAAPAVKPTAEAETPAAAPRKTEPKPKAKATAEPTPEPAPEPVADFRGDTSAAYQYFENWSTGLDGWQDDSVQKGSNTVAAPKKGGRLLLKLKEKALYGKFASPAKALVVDFATHPYFEIELDRELESGSMKVNFVPVRNPDNFRTIVSQFNRRGVYVVNVPETAGWTEKEAFFIEIWLEGADTQVTISAVGFSRKMSVNQGLASAVLSVNPADDQPDKNANILKVGGVADQTFRAGWKDGLLATQDPARLQADPGVVGGINNSKGTTWKLRDRYGNTFDQIGYSEIAQKLYLNTGIFPMKDVEIYASLGYDLVNGINGITWEDPYGRAINPKLDYAMLRFYDFYVGNVAQIGSVYDPLFTDMTLKKTSTFRAFLWKPKFSDVQVKMIATRMATNQGDYKNNTYLLGGRITDFFSGDLGSLRLGVSALNLSETNGELDNDPFQGRVGQPVYSKFVPSVYMQVKNAGSSGLVYYNFTFNNKITIQYAASGASGAGSLVADLNPPDGNRFLFTSNRVYTDAVNRAVDIAQDGTAVYKVSLVDAMGNAIDPARITDITTDFVVGPGSTTLTGSLQIAVSADAANWLNPSGNAVSLSFDTTHTNTEGFSGFSFLSVLTALKGQKFDATEGTIARSILGVDFSGQVLGVNVDGEYAASIAHNQNYHGDHINHQANAFYVRANRGFSGALVKAAYFNIAPDYDTSLNGVNTVADNDNGSMLQDGFADKAGVVFGDYSNRGYPDKEYTVGIFVPQDYLAGENEDRNHNGVLDTRENDHIPDYTYRPDQQGYDASILIPRQVLEGTLAANLEAELRAQNIKRISVAGRNQTVDLQLNYIRSDVEDWLFKAGVYVANISDDLSDQYTFYDAWDNTITASNNYTHNLVATPSLQVNYDTPWGLKATVLDRYRLNKPFAAELSPTYANETVVDLRYKHYLINAWSITPIYIGTFNGATANSTAPIYNSYYLPANSTGNYKNMPIYHQFYLKNSFPIMNQYQVAVDAGREIYLLAEQGQANLIKDTLAMGILRNIPRGYLRIQYQLQKLYYPYANYLNSAQAGLWAQLTVSF
jgi:hypothetical protein